MGNGEQLEKLRAQIDQLDEKIQSLISERASCALEVARVKRGLGEQATFYRPEREAEILRAVLARNKGPLPDDEMARLFREIMSACLAAEAPLTIAFLGPEGTFTQAAALKHFGHSVATVPLGTIDEVFREVAAGNASFGVVPVENSTEGVVTHTLDMFMQSSLKVCGEVQFRIHHHLLGSSADLAQVRRVISHQQSLGQCREWLNAKLPGVQVEAVSSNAEAARRVVGDPTAAAIAGAAAAEIYGLDVLARNIEDKPDNTTRFLVIGTLEAGPSGSDKTSLMVTSRNRPGALHRLLAPLAAHGISMTRIESRPTRQGLWEYVFFIDVEGHASDANLAAALVELEQEAASVRLLGSYPRAVL
jgi:chorismate mutase/prephenate dehydratase